LTGGKPGLELAGFQVHDVRHVFGGQYLSAEASLAPGDSTPVSLQTGNLASLFEQFGASERELIEMWRTNLDQLGTAGRVASYTHQPPEHQVRSAIVINPNYLEEILAMVRTAHLTVDLVDAVGWQAATCTSP